VDGSWNPFMNVDKTQLIFKAEFAPFIAVGVMLKLTKFDPVLSKLPTDELAYGLL